jgi:TPR repeat protein
MKRIALLSLLAPLLFAPFSIGAPQSTYSAQAAFPSAARHQWTEDRYKATLSRAQHGDVDSQFWLGTGYEQGWFGNPNFKEALKWLHRAAERGDPDAQNALGQMYQDGEGVWQNYSRAAQWYRRAAEHVPDHGGSGQGRNNLGLLYLDGLGVPKDYVKACMWLTLAHNLSDAKAVAAEMTAAQILESEQMVAEWRSSHPER